MYAEPYTTSSIPNYTNSLSLVYSFDSSSTHQPPIASSDPLGVAIYDILLLLYILYIYKEKQKNLTKQPF